LMDFSWDFVLPAGKLLLWRPYWAGRPIGRIAIAFSTLDLRSETAQAGFKEGV
jgi:hypothetical protein